MAGANQVARLSALTAMGKVARVVPAVAKGGELVVQVLLHQLHMVGMVAQAAAGLGGRAGLPTYHQRTAHALFQQPDALGSRRWCHVQGAGRAFKAAFSHHSGQGEEGRVVQHVFSFSSFG